MVDVAEWKRRQAPVGVRVSPKAFGRDRRMPITNRYRG
jgi:NAD+ synthase (glutamine-hydrolysing)